ncbi:hypothetical protein DYB25_002104 [Aphanomyces astaci]|uniref:Coilin n=1 Tax=Aphanomyces astaci TaxID=112090 RepID=A0A397DNI3_APHAT|nr:hypothetical protein DYB36_006433 [Aphanomyces astaci]RHY20553.1 hypothetical protein DYB25_002104 [Aphanomyces astaci]RHY48125.1 hypothetical protein DYB34_009905 [Aphanomyces astaci]RHY49297.1 hypothetical protein DYB30_002365 [Aphanomyces astaci]RHY68408.1 hypothetical protein DYB38_009700 [Aphanomyces astaci]
MAGVKRVRVEFVDDAAAEMMVEWGFSRVVVPIDKSMKHVSDLLHGIVRRFGLSNGGYDLMLGDYAILPSDKLELVLQPEDNLTFRKAVAAPSKLVTAKREKQRRVKVPRVKLPVVSAKAKAKTIDDHPESVQTKRAAVAPKAKAASNKERIATRVLASEPIPPKKRPAETTTGRERKKKRARHVDVVRASPSEPIAPTAIVPPKETSFKAAEPRRGHLRFDPVGTANTTTTCTTTPVELARSVPVVRGTADRRTIPHDLQKYGPRQGTKRQNGGLPLPPPIVVEPSIPSLPEPIKSVPAISNEVSEPRPPKLVLHADSSNEVWKRKYTVIASVNRKHDGDISTVGENDVIAFKTVTLCEVHFEPRVSEWKVGRVTGCSTDPHVVSVQLATWLDCEYDVTAFNVADFFQVRQVKTANPNIVVAVPAETPSMEDPNSVDETHDLLEALRRRKEEILMSSTSA